MMGFAISAAPHRTKDKTPQRKVIVKNHRPYNDRHHYQHQPRPRFHRHYPRVVYQPRPRYFFHPGFSLFFKL